MKALATVLAIVSCVAGNVSCVSGYETLATDVDPNGWHGEVRWKYDNRDTLAYKDISFTFRYGTEVVQHTGVYVVEVATPSGGRIEDALRVTIDPTANNNLHEVTAVFRTSARFAETGSYFFTLTPLQITRGVWSVALDLRKTVTPMTD